MAKKLNLKRVIDRAGQVRYYGNGKRISDKRGVKKYVTENFTSIEPAILSKKELNSFQRSKVQRSLDRFNGRPVNKLISYVYRDLLKTIGPEAVDFAKIKSSDGTQAFKRYSDVLRQVDFAEQNFPLEFQIQTSKGAPGFRGRESITSVVDMIEHFKNPVFSNLKYVAYLPGFMSTEVASGKIMVFEAISKFETYITESVMEGDRQNVAFVKFDYIPEYDFVNRVVTFDIRIKNEPLDFRDFADYTYYSCIVSVMTSDPVKRTSNTWK